MMVNNSSENSPNKKNTDLVVKGFVYFILYIIIIELNDLLAIGSCKIALCCFYRNSATVLLWFSQVRQSFGIK